MDTYTKEDKFVELISKIPNVAVQGYNKERIVIYWNEASEKIYGYTKKEALGKKLEDLIIPEFMKENVILGIKNWYENNVPIPVGELSLKHKNNSTVCVFSSHVMIKEDSSNPEMFCVDIDLTEQKRQEQYLKDNDKNLNSTIKNGYNWRNARKYSTSMETTFKYNFNNSKWHKSTERIWNIR